MIYAMLAQRCTRINGSIDPDHAHLGSFVIPRLVLEVDMTYLETKFED